MDTVSCFLCGAKRDGWRLVNHLTFWHGAPEDQARLAVTRLEAGMEVSVDVLAGTHPSVWRQLELFPEGTVRAKRSLYP